MAEKMVTHAKKGACPHLFSVANLHRSPTPSCRHPCQPSPCRLVCADTGHGAEALHRYRRALQVRDRDCGCGCGCGRDARVWLCDWLCVCGCVRVSWWRLSLTARCVLIPATAPAATPASFEPGSAPTTTRRWPCSSSWTGACTCSAPSSLRGWWWVLRWRPVWRVACGSVVVCGVASLLLPSRYARSPHTSHTLASPPQA